jgi:hypothetical protein
VARRSERQKLYDDSSDQQHRLRQSNPSISELLPSVKAVRINLTFEDPNRPGKQTPKQLTFRPEQKAFFHIPCLFRKCVGGGFDLAPVVRGAMRAHAVSVFGEQKCQGWQQSERIGMHRCWLKARYDIQIEYGGATTVTAWTLALAATSNPWRARAAR